MIERNERDGVRTLTLAHGKVNAIDVELCQALTRELGEARQVSVKAVILTGSGSSFSAGVDLFRLVGEGQDYARRFLPALDELLRDVLTFPKPVLAAINGHAIAGGCILAAACDYRIMAHGTGRIGIPELAVGVPFPALPLQIMAARLSDAAMRDLVFTGRTLVVDEAKALGLIDDTCSREMLLDRAHEVAHKWMAIPSPAFVLTKEAFYSPVLEKTKQLASLNARVSEEWLQPHTREAIRNYLARTIKK